MLDLIPDLFPVHSQRHDAPGWAVVFAEEAPGKLKPLTVSALGKGFLPQHEAERSAQLCPGELERIILITPSTNNSCLVPSILSLFAISLLV
ncbi:MAG: hypothetical protein IKH57_08340 [Clostridia bacterium]|nr:hypothetical protein [Clostridia bacterium]